MRQPKAPSNSTSEEALERLPSLSLSRWRRIALTLPSGRKRGTRKQVRPPGAWASTRKASHIGADMNHLWPVSAVFVACSGLRPGGVGPDVGAALLLGHPHAEGDGGLLPEGKKRGS